MASGREGGEAGPRWPPPSRTHLRAEREVEALGAREDVGGLDEVGDADGARCREHGRSLLCRVGDLEDIEAGLLGIEAVQHVRVDFAAQGGAGQGGHARHVRWVEGRLSPPPLPPHGKPTGTPVFEVGAEVGRAALDALLLEVVVDPAQEDVLRRLRHERLQALALAHEAELRQEEAGGRVRRTPLPPRITTAATHELGVLLDGDLVHELRLDDLPHEAEDEVLLVVLSRPHQVAAKQPQSATKAGPLPARGALTERGC